MSNPQDATNMLSSFLETEVRALEADANNAIQALNVSRREYVRGYFTALWIWHRLDPERWKKSKIQLRIGRRIKTSLDVDHTVAFGLWDKKVEEGLPKGFAKKDEAMPIVNKLGNCALLEKSFNISKSDKALRLFIEEVHELKENKISLSEWAAALSIPEVMLDPRGFDATTIANEIDVRDKLIRKDLIDFVKGDKKRVDIEDEN